MKSRDPMVDHLLELLQPLEAVDATRMFGAWGVRVGGIMIGLVAGETVYLKVDERTRPTFEAIGSMPFVFMMKDRSVTTSYWSVPDGAMDSSAAMLPWARLALDAALRKAAARPVRTSSARASAQKSNQHASSEVASSTSDGDSQQCDPSARSPSAAKRRR